MATPSCPAGGDRRYFYPKYVWSPSGGWWNHTPANYKGSLLVASIAMGGIFYAIFTASANNEVRGGVPCALPRPPPSCVVYPCAVVLLICSPQLRMCLLPPQRRPIPPRFPIPSQMWCRYAGNDDPRAGTPYVKKSE